MNAADCRRIALSFEGAEESSHMGAPDFRVGGRIFATLASQDQGFGNLMLTPEQQADFVRELPNVFLPVRGGCGRMGPTSVWRGRTRTCWRSRCSRPGSSESRRMQKRAERSVRAVAEFQRARMSSPGASGFPAVPVSWQKNERRRDHSPPFCFAAILLPALRPRSSCTSPRQESPTAL